MSERETPGPAVDAFVIAYCGGANVTTAAKKAGISRSTATRLLRDPRVIADIAAIRVEIRRRAVDRLTNAVDIAVAALVHHAGADVEPTAGSSVSAARGLLAEARTWVEVEELRQRVDALEDRTVLPTGPRAAVLELLERLHGEGDDGAPKGE